MDAVSDVRVAHSKPAAVRQPRTERHRVAVRLTDRDRLVLEALGRFRIARTTDLVLTGFRDVHPMTASMRLRRLYDAGFLDVHAGHIGTENVYRLGPNADAWRVGRIPRGNLEHHLGVVRAWTTLAAGSPARGLEVELARPDWELRGEVAGAELVPDLFMVLGGVGLAVELDCGTEPLSVIARKLDLYGSLDRLFGYPFVVTAVADRAIPGVHVWSATAGPDSCYDLLLQQQERSPRN